MFSLNVQALWPDDKRNVVYCFGGNNFGMSYKDPSDSIQAFTPDGKGGGEWAEILGLVGEKRFPYDIHAVSYGEFTSDVDEGFYLGGVMGDITTPFSNSDGLDLSNGLLRLNFESLSFTNSTKPDIPYSSYQRTGDYGVLLNVPIYGPKGVLLLFGGGYDGFIEGFNSINIFDKAENKWHNQTADGDVPPPRQYFCAVGVHGTNHTSFEM